MTRLPRLVVAAPASGSGKTTVATGLMVAFARAGLDVSPHKVGPDYIDPGYHALAVSGARDGAGRSPAGSPGRPGRNLDAFLCGSQLLAPLLLHGAAGADLAVIEGVMGLYDGAAGRGEEASTAQAAKVLRAPVVLVVDASSQSRSVAALVHGFVSWDPEVRIAGVILNKVGSARHEELLREAMEAVGIPVVGVLHRADPVRTPARHLGLVPVAERRREAVEAVAELADRVARGVDLQALLALAHSAPPLPQQPWSATGAVRSAAGRHPQEDPRAEEDGPARKNGAASGEAAEDWPAGVEGAPAGRPVVAVAGGAAFTFSYAEHTELLHAAGAQVVTFDPLHEERLPEGADALVIGGGFPEVYADELAANEPLAREVAAFRGPIAAECAGLLYLGRELDGRPMCGLLDLTATMTDRLTLGYREAVAVADNVLAAAGTRVRGHEFHRTATAPAAGDPPAWGVLGPPRRTEGFADERLHASYLHLHWAAHPELAGRLVARAAAHRAAR
ncbi:cobyrinate a,c-diamide synthase [Streptomyces sp. XM4193]|uniref:cobyrinate a,c-diamide synthase n=1 Tax=Streptomyces sp. XM4193 TaxID=2929782 RepID=UPI001FFACDF8|nr:cobyrinate a,c-diamide synthase [Streptomyces sp. XM4193]MCK1796515.1 cobyrinate a,c-diamide synthase [Streptomyces sp. XM4193]